MHWLASVCIAAIVASVDLPSYPFARYAETQETYQRAINPHARHFVIPVEKRDENDRIYWIASTVSILISGTSYSVPADWNNSDNSIECIGAGGKGSDTGGSSAGGGAGGGGGAYAKKLNLSLTPSGTATYQIGVNGGTTTIPGGTVHSWFSSNVTVRAAGGASTTNDTGGAGGTTANSIGDTKFAGGTGGFGFQSNGGGGGGGAGAPAAAGRNGGDGGDTGQGGGGGGGGGGTGSSVGGSSTSSTGGTAGTGGTGSGNGGAGGNNNASGVAGSAGTVFQASPARGPGGGGGGGGDSATSTAGGAGGSYGGGGGGAGGANTGSQAAGGDGIIVVTYTSLSTPYGWNVSDPNNVISRTTIVSY